MTVAEIGIVGTLILTALGMLARGIWLLWQDRNRAQREAIAEAEQRALATARSEALLREANAALDAKNTEIATIKEVSASELADVRGQLSTCHDANAELRQLLLQCTRGQRSGGGP